MAPIAAKIISTPVALLLHVVAGFFVVGHAQIEFGAPLATKFPYGFLLLLTLVPLLVSIWWPRATFWRRISAWAAGTAATVVSFMALHPVALEAHLPGTLAAVWPLLSLAAVTPLFGILAAWIVLRSWRRTTSSRPPA